MAASPASPHFPSGDAAYYHLYLNSAILTCAKMCTNYLDVFVYERERERERERNYWGEERGEKRYYSPLVPVE